MAAPPSGTVTLLFTDIEGSTRLWDSEPEQMHAALVRHDELVRSAVEAVGGYVFKTVGDAFCVAFPTAASAVAGAVAAQRALAGERWPEQATIKARTALHSGRCNERDGDYFGPTVNRAARLEAIAHGGQLLLSGATVALLNDDRPDGFDLRDMGEHRLKDLSGAEHVFQAVISGLPDEFPPLRSLGNSSFHHNLPRYATSFIGRESQLREVQDLIETGRLLTLVGAGGSGKTRLAVQVAAEMLDGSDDGVWLVELASVTEPAQVTMKIASVLGIEASAGRTLDDTLLDALASRRLLLVLDNCEHVIDAVAGFTDAVLTSGAQVALLATSREPLDVAGEQVVRLSTLGSPAAGVDLATIEASEAVCLFVERAQAHRRDCELTAENADAVASICRQLDGLPLAIELAAAAVRMFTVSEIASRLDERFLLLAGGGRRTALERHQTLRSVVDWSYDLLDDSQRDAFARLSVFSGGWTLDAAEAVCSTSGDEGVPVIALTRALVDKSLVETIPLDDGSTRYDMLETIRAYAAETLTAGGHAIVDAARTAHLHHFVELAEAAAPKLLERDQAAWFDRLDADAANLHAALAYGVGHDPASALRLSVALHHYWRRRSYAAPVIANVRAVIADASTATPSLYADGLLVLARLEWTLGGLISATECAERAIAIAQESGDQTRLAYALAEKAWICFLRGDNADATSCSDAALELARNLSDEALLAHCEHNAGAAQSRTRDAAACIEHHEAALEYFERRGDELGRAFALVNISAAETERPDPNFERATTYSRQAFEIFERQKEPYGAAHALDNLAWVLANEGHADDALALFREVLSRAHRLGDLPLMAFTLVRVAPLLVHAAPTTSELIGYADTLMQRLGLAPNPWDRDSYATAVRHCRDTLGEDAFRTHCSHGALLTASDVVDLACGDAHSRARPPGQVP